VWRVTLRACLARTRRNAATFLLLPRWRLPPRRAAHLYGYHLPFYHRALFAAGRFSHTYRAHGFDLGRHIVFKTVLDSSGSPGFARDALLYRRCLLLAVRCIHHSYYWQRWFGILRLRHRHLLSVRADMTASCLAALRTSGAHTACLPASLSYILSCQDLAASAVPAALSLLSHVAAVQPQQQRLGVTGSGMAGTALALAAGVGGRRKSGLMPRCTTAHTRARPAAKVRGGA